MRRFVIAFGTVGLSLGSRPLVKVVRFSDFTVLFGREQTPGQWS